MKVEKAEELITDIFFPEILCGDFCYTKFVYRDGFVFYGFRRNNIRDAMMFCLRYSYMELTLSDKRKAFKEKYINSEELFTEFNEIRNFIERCD